jgi:ferredoxin
MKGLICYFSGSGNTKLAMQYLSSKIKNVEFELCNIKKETGPDFSKYDVVGFATYTDFFGPSKYFYSFFEGIKNQPDKYAFVFNTYGCISSDTIQKLKKLAETKGFKVLSGHSLHCPESYPPMRKSKLPFDNSPNRKELIRFDNFINNLSKQIEDIKNNESPKYKKIKSPLISYFFQYSRDKAKKDFGIQNINDSLCDACGACAELCPYKAIRLMPKPIFDHNKCNGCWVCYNHCTRKAIYTRKFSGDFQYAKPSEALLKKLTI